MAPTPICLTVCSLNTSFIAKRMAHTSSMMPWVTSFMVCRKKVMVVRYEMVAAREDGIPSE